jgi:hypothetical protein
MRVVSEFEVDNEPAWTNAPFFRQWEVAGGGHTDHDTSLYLVPEEDREWGRAGGLTWPLAPTDEPGCLLDRIPKYLAIQAALVGLNTWVGTGRAPATAPRIEVAKGAIVRDPFGNAVSGLRLPEEDVPSGANYGEMFNECAPTLGKTVPFSASQLKGLYPTHRSYVEQFTEAADRAVDNGWLVPADARTMIKDASQSHIGS